MSKETIIAVAKSSAIIVLVNAAAVIYSHSTDVSSKVRNRAFMAAGAVTGMMAVLIIWEIKNAKK